MEWIVAHIDDIISVILQIIGAASIIVNFTETKKDDEWLGKINTVVHLLAANYFLKKKPHGNQNETK